MKKRLFLNLSLAYGVAALIGKLLIAAPAVADTSGPVIVALGDSLTQGYGLMEHEGFVPQLRDWLSANGVDAFRVINAGVSGDTTAGGLSRVAWTLTPDVDAMIVALGGNDLLRGIDPAVTRANIDGILSEAQKSGVAVLLVGMQAPGNYGPDYQRDFQAIWPDMAAKYDTLLVDSFFAGLGEDIDPAQMRGVFQPDGIHPNAEGVKRIVDGLGPHVLDLIERIPD
ncbi:acyl-CoA thioesterase-1 [Lutimaribacter pacificus]|uniref:Acyl-CoA thioesterase-1 n=1 Tax=Lutimaribacter pacificus TaxID=391948 RepID=A0A1H0KZC7_9RHOB|nr:arylesterase [Lutimaribacter pacificus]SDO61111.1 acyl-CoA thioesterase-1 [Lutimaribacter pacificus]SHK72523.1 acyl-CoA thioesterase-1 [Lutimaribacter pacificus]